MNKYEQSKFFFDNTIEEYADEITSIQPIFYENSAKIINKAIESDKKVLDIGNGGVINYNFSHLEYLHCGDLSISNRAVDRYKDYSNVHFVEANILNLKNIQNNLYDAVIVQTVIHHLADSTLKQTNINVRTAIMECIRVLKPGGQLLIIESTVNRPFEQVERMLYPLMQSFFKICKFGAVFQYSPVSLVKLIKDMNIPVEDTYPVLLDRYVWIMRKRIPSMLTPCGAIFIKIVKE